MPWYSLSSRAGQRGLRARIQLLAHFKIVLAVVMASLILEEFSRLNVLSALDDKILGRIPDFLFIPKTKIMPCHLDILR